MRRSVISTISLAACGLAITSNAQLPDSGSSRVIVDVDTCVNLETREQQLECYGNRVNEVLRAREAQANANANANVNEPETTIVSDVTVEPEPSRASRSAERREAREAETRQREADEAAAAAAAAVEAAVAAAAEAIAAAEDPSYTAGEIVAKITQLREMEPDAYFVYLDNGQVWRQNVPKSYLLRIGAEVRLRPGRMGPSYRLTDPEVGNFIQVRRVR